MSNTEESLLKGLNEPQRQAVTTRDGPILVLAGAGSGKTKTLVHRLAYLISEAGIPPEQILAVTFTNQAAKEMRQRVQALIGRQLKGQSTVGTFHSVSARFLRREAAAVSYPSHYSIYDEDDQLSLIKEALKAQGIGLKLVSPKVVQASISRAKAELVTADSYLDWAERSPFSSLVAQIYQRYQALLQRDQAFDFDDLLMKMVEIWQANPSLLAAYQECFHYLLVDEYQDVNRAQYVWTKLLAEARKNLCVVGDDWQSIYSWRGADFGNILRFHEDYPEATIIKLEQNYRSTKIIIEASNAVMAKAELKADKTLWTNNAVGELVKIVAVEDEVAEGTYVVNEVMKLSQGTPELDYEPIEDGLLPEVGTLRRYQGTGEELKDYAVLYRTNAQSRALEEACLKTGLPYQLIGGTRFYERKEIKDVLAYLRLIMNNFDGVSFRRAVVVPARGLGLVTIEAVLKYTSDHKISPLAAAQEINLSGERGRLLKEFASLINGLSKAVSQHSVAEMIDLVMEKSGLKQELIDGTPDGEARWQNVMELKTVAEERSPGKGQEALEQFLAEVALWQDQDSYKSRERGLTLMTFHAAKGLEFKVVFMVGMEEGLFPHASAFADPRELDEERRLAYVGLTRARHRVYCLYAFNRRLFGTLGPGIPSRFIAELPPNCVESVIGSRFI